MADWDVTRRYAGEFGFDYGAEVFETSTGRTNKYLDGLALLMSEWSAWRHYFNKRVERLGYPVPVCTGRSGAFLLGLLGRGVLVSFEGAKGGPEVLGGDSTVSIEARARGVVLIDDVCFTHGTLDRLRSWADARDLDVRGEIVALPYMREGELAAESMTVILG